MDEETATLVAQMRETGRVSIGFAMEVWVGALGRVWIGDGRDVISAVNREQRHQLAAVLAWDQEEERDV